MLAGELVGEHPTDPWSAEARALLSGLPEARIELARQHDEDKDEEVPHSGMVTPSSLFCQACPGYDQLGPYTSELLSCTGEQTG